LRERTYLNIATAGLMFDIVLRANVGLGLILEVHFKGLDLLIAASRLMGRIVQ